ncbi:helix-turn-helix transcriptional regulator [Glycomyces tenuis]|uniref:helix-turn-helix transcriptional regulator n=1 Tax=Glycomyces tenuis TaxID=58116 RepID=UPI00040B1450|nr:AraC family transcriptional regulator [Glycomyces tenuis]
MKSRTPTETHVDWAGSVHLAPGLLAFTGRIGDAEAHTHACLQLLIVTSGRIVLADARGARRPVEGIAIIPAGVPHQVTAGPETAGLAAYLDADSAAGRAAAARLRRTGADPRQVETWTGTAAQPAQAPATTPPRPAPHPTLAAAIDLATTDPGGPPDLAALASRVPVSASRLGHLFAEHLGLSYPAWRRWIRLQRALEAVRAGADLTAAAHTAGFADSAHLSRTTRAMFGLTPTRAARAAGWRP